MAGQAETDREEEVVRRGAVQRKLEATKASHAQQRMLAHDKCPEPMVEGWTMFCVAEDGEPLHRYELDVVLFAQEMAAEAKRAASGNRVAS